MRRSTTRQLEQTPARTLRDAAKGPISITHRGQPAYVLMSYEHYLTLPGVRARTHLLALLAHRVGTGSAPE